MGDIRNEPSMEDILASIKRIIAEDGATALAGQRPKKGAPLPGTPTEESGTRPMIEEADMDEEVLELTDSLEVDTSQPAPNPTPSATPRVEASNGRPQPVVVEVEPDEALMSDETVARGEAAMEQIMSDAAAAASRHSLAALSAMVVKPEPNGDNTLEGLVREMLRPMLAQWLDANLPQLVERMVEREVARISGRSL